MPTCHFLTTNAPSMVLFNLCQVTHFLEFRAMGNLRTGRRKTCRPQLQTGYFADHKTADQSWLVLY